MLGGAEVKPEFSIIVITDPAGDAYGGFAPPNNQSSADYAIGLHAQQYGPDGGGTLQIGIGSLNAIAQALIVRDRHSAEYRQLLKARARWARRASWFDQALRLFGDVRQRLPALDRSRHHPPVKCSPTCCFRRSSTKGASRTKR